MKAEIKVEIGGVERTLAMPFAGIEDVAAVNPYPAELLDSFRFNVWKASELKAILDAGAKYGNAGVTAEQIIEEVGLKRASEMARDLWAAAWADDSGNSDAAAKSKGDSVSAPASGSSQAA